LAALAAFFFVLIGMIVRNRGVVTAGLVLAIIGGLCGGAAFWSGKEADETIDKSPPIAGVDKTMIEEHEDAADFALASTCIAGCMAIVTLFVGRRRGQRPRWMEVVMAILLLWSFSVVARTAYLGGKIHHPEVRAAVRG